MKPESIAHIVKERADNYFRFSIAGFNPAHVPATMFSGNMVHYFMFTVYRFWPTLSLSLSERQYLLTVLPAEEEQHYQSGDTAESDFLQKNSCPGKSEFLPLLLQSDSCTDSDHSE